MNYLYKKINKKCVINNLGYVNNNFLTTNLNI